MLFAGAPPVSIEGKVLIAVVMLLLSAILVRVGKGKALTYKSKALAVVAAVIGVAALEVVLPRHYGSALHDRGILAAIIGGLSAAIFLSSGQRQGQIKNGSARRVWQLSIVALVCGPLVGLFFAVLAVFFGQITPNDYAAILVCAGVGSIGGAIGAGIVAVLASASSSSGPKNNSTGDETSAGASTATTQPPS